MQDASDGAGARGASSGAAGDFDEPAFYDRLAELNPWLREPEDQHETLRRAATHARYAEGKDAWNAWAKPLLAEKKRLEQRGEWAAGRLWGTMQEGGNAAT
ncbi:MAG: hypothetical protein ACFCUN_05175, partial [Hyphomicrobiaceae bacterium]